MKIRLHSALLALALASGCAHLPWDSQDTALHVSPAGDDAASGSAAHPLKTLAAARMAARRAKADARPVTIHLHGGTYYQAEPLVLSAEDSGTAAAPVVWQAEPGDEVVISGGMTLALQWTPGKNGIWQAQTPANLDMDQLFASGTRQVLARHPNFDPKAKVFNGVAADCISPARVARWRDPVGGLFHAMHTGHWGSMCWRITGKDAQNNVALEGGWQINQRSGPHTHDRFVENIFEELDAPGEWFHDAKTRTLYFYPPAGLDLAKATFETPRLRNIVEFHGSAAGPVKFVTFKGLTFRHTQRTVMEANEPLLRTDWSICRAGAVFLENAEDCALEDCVVDQAGGNGVFVNNRARNIRITGCRIDKAGSSAILFVGDPKAARNPKFQYAQTNSLREIDLTPGPQTDNYPADCRVEECLITEPGRVEKQGTGIGIDLARRITVSHCTVYDTPRAGINIGDGCWGGHVIEHCDVFNTVMETGDHGAFNSWGRDRFWHLRDCDAAQIGLPFDDKKMDLPRLDVVEPNIIRNSRWRCDHGWDIDLDDGSSNYRIYNNLCLSGGLKNREGFHRSVENNITANNSFHPHVWYANSQDVFARNIVFGGYAPIGMPGAWGKEVDFNLCHNPGIPTPQAWVGKAGQDAHSQTGDALFENPAIGDFRVKPGSPALALGFKNFPMDRFGVQKPELKRLAKTAPIGKNGEAKPVRDGNVRDWSGAKLRNIIGQGEMSVYGTPGETGVRVMELPANHPFAQAGLQKDDVIIGAGGKDVLELADLLRADAAEKNRRPLELRVLRKQQPVIVKVP